MIGRNEPCPCGSGKKYKVCCLGKQAHSGAAQALRMREIQGWLEQRLVRFARRQIGEAGFASAWKEFA